MAKNLPNDLQRSLLENLPIKSLLRFKIVSKLWCSWMEDPSFSRSHRQIPKFITEEQRQSGQMLMIILDSSEDYSVVKLPDLPFKNHHLRRISLCGSCNGLTCLADVQNIVLCNIPTKEHHIVPLEPEGIPKDYNRMVWKYGFGYDSINDDYKVLRINSFHVHTQCFNQIQVYSLRNDSWSSPHPPSFLEGLHIGERINGSNGLLIFGALHWIALVSYKNPFILAFDLSKEEFGKIVLPESLGYSPVLGILGGCLALSCHNYLRCSDFDLWVMKDYMVSESWSKPFTISIDGWIEYLIPLTYSESGNKILFESHRWGLLWYDLRREQVENPSCPNLVSGAYGTVSYLESLVSIRAYKGCQKDQDN